MHSNLKINMHPTIEILKVLPRINARGIILTLGIADIMYIGM